MLLLLLTVLLALAADEGACKCSVFMAARPASLLCLQTSIVISILQLLFCSVIQQQLMFYSVLFYSVCTAMFGLVMIDDSIIK